MANRYILNRCSTSLINREMHIKATMRYLLTSVGMTTSKKTNAGEDVEKRKSLCRAMGNVN